MRLAFVLVLLTHTVFADPVLPDRETEIQGNQVRVFARLGDCDRALEAGKEVAERDTAYYRQLVATDAGLFACHHEREAGRRYQSWRDRQPRSYTHRIGVDGMASFGPILTLGGWLRYERTSGLVVRAGYVAGQIMESEDDGFDAAAVHVGYRAYYGGFYLHAEAGGVAVRERAFFDYLEEEPRPARWHLLPSAIAGLGGKVGRTDLGISVLFPAVGIGAHLGFDFARL